MKTNSESFCSGKLCEGCNRCLVGRKLVLFITGICPRNCEYCPLSDKRKNVDKIFANEKEVRSVKEVFSEVNLSGANSCGITGGDPLVKLDRTIKYADALKKKYGKNFHIHIYVSTQLVTRENIRRLSKVVDEIRFHPEIEGNFEEEIKKINYANEFFEKKNIGIEIPLFPKKKKETFAFIEKAIPYLGFINLNELEIGEANFDWIGKNYSMNKDSYTIKGSLELGKDIIKKFGNKINIHLCTAKTKNWYQYRNRLKNYKILKFSKRIDDGTVIYFSTKDKDIKKLLNKEDYYLDKPKKQFIINPNKILGLHGKLEISKIEEYPTSDRDIVESEVI